MEKQYYTPKIEHFHVGFRYEFKQELTIYIDEKEPIVNNDWIKGVTSMDFPNPTLPMIATMIENGTVQVKPLDHDDIIEAGWVKKGRFYSLEVIEFEQGVSPLDCFGISKGDLWYYIAKVGSKYLIFNEANDVLFKGKVPNYNKLLDVMEMLEIRN